MKVRFIKNCLVRGAHYGVGTVHEFDEDTTNVLIAHRRAEPFTGEVVNADPAVETRDPVINRDSRPSRRAKA